MSSRKRRPFNITRWVVLVVFVLLIESCVLASIAGAVLASRGQLTLPAGILPQIGALSTRISSPATAVGGPALEQTVIPSPPVNRRTQTAIASNQNGSETQATETPTPWENPPPGKIVYVCFDGKFDQICLMNSDGTQQRQLTNVEATNFYPSLSPDGSQIVFSSNRTGVFEIFSMDIQGGNLNRLTDKMGNLYAPAISPNGNRIVFTHETGGQQDIWVMRSDGSNPHPLTDTGGNIDPAWSPDGEQIAFASSRNGANQLFTMSANGNNQRSINAPSAPKIGGRLSWSPDGNWLAFYAGASGDRNIYIISPDGRNLSQLTNGGDNLGPSFSTDGNWITFTSFRDGNNEIYIMKLDGSNQIRLTQRSNSDWQPRWGP